jgi:hypothetical protein
MKELLYKKCASVETTNEENCTEGIDSEENYVSIQEDVEEAIPDGAKPIPVTTLNSWPTFCQPFGIIGTKLRLEKYLQDASAGFALLEWTPCPISTATQETCIKMIIIPSPKKNL